MKKALFTLAFFFVMMGAAFAQTVYDFTLINKTGYEIYYVYVSPSDEDEWGDDVLNSEETIPNNARRLIEFDEDYADILSAFDVSKFDLKVVDEDGDEMIFTDIALDRVSTIELSWRNGRGTATTR